jgi:FlaG/FlaF family flagellin (archaellin)
MRRLLVAIVVIAALSAVVVGDVLAGNPSPTGTGQPSQSCQDGTTGPPGIFIMNNGFANTAVNVYANPKTLPNGNEINANAVSQYDVACYQVRTH